jgi:SynChlorMet cassette protein ScmC
MVCLRLANGSSWSIAGRNSMADSMVERLADAMQLRSSVNASHTLALTVLDDPSHRESPVLNGISVEYTLGRVLGEDMLASRLQEISQLIALASQETGGMLLHGALIEKDGEGVVLTGHGGAGKSTAAGRVPPPWRSLCDDTTLIVRDRDGAYRAHPWPTWSSFMFGGAGGTWQTEHSVPLRAVFVLEQAPEDHTDSLGGGETACLLAECGEQVTWPAFHNLPEEQVRSLRARRFDNICDMTRAVPAFRLRLSLTGTFWNEIESLL